MDNGSDVEVVESRMADLKSSYLSVQEKHEEHVSNLNLEENDSALKGHDAWILSVDGEFEEAEEKKVYYVRKKIAEKDVKPKIGLSEDMQCQCLSMRNIEEAAFNTIHESLDCKIKTQMSAEEPILHVIKDELSDLKRQLDVCKQVHHKYVATLSDIPSPQIKWVATLQDKVLKMNTRYSSLTEKKESKKWFTLRKNQNAKI